MDNYDHITKHQESLERTSVLANERTYAAWVRTGLTALASGLGIEEFLGDGSVVPAGITRAISLILLASSGLCFFLAAWRYQHVGVRMVSTHVSGAPISLMIFLSTVLITVSLLALVGIGIINS
jgi:putative membrane protein